MYAYISPYYTNIITFIVFDAIDISAVIIICSILSTIIFTFLVIILVIALPIILFITIKLIHYLPIFIKRFLYYLCIYFMKMLGTNRCMIIKGIIIDFIASPLFFTYLFYIKIIIKTLIWILYVKYTYDKPNYQTIHDADFEYLKCPVCESQETPGEGQDFYYITSSMWCPPFRCITWPDENGMLWTEGNWDYVCYIPEKEAKPYIKFFTELEKAKDHMDDVVTTIKNRGDIHHITGAFYMHFGDFYLPDPIFNVQDHFHTNSPTYKMDEYITLKLDEMRFNWDLVWKQSRPNYSHDIIIHGGNKIITGTIKDSVVNDVSWSHDIVRVFGGRNSILANMMGHEYYLARSSPNRFFVMMQLKTYCEKQSLILDEILKLKGAMATLEGYKPNAY